MLPTPLKRRPCEWLLANISNKDGTTLANAKRYMMIEWEGIKIGIVGLIEEEWIDTLTIDDALDYTDFVVAGHDFAQRMKDEGAEVLIALTHMRLQNDQLLAAKCPEYDLILGGHDHFTHVQAFDQRWLLKSGTEFRNMGEIKVDWNRHHIEARMLDIDGDIVEDPRVVEIIATLESDLAKKMDKVIGYTEVALDARVTEIRMGEAVVGNFICDIMMHEFDTDCAMLNSGTIRSDDVIPVGPIRVKGLFGSSLPSSSPDITNLLPYEDTCIVIKIEGKTLLAALENGVSMYPKQEGRFPQVAGLCFSFDPSLPPRKRIVGDVLVQGKPLELNGWYKVATKGYMLEGRDGYDMLLNAHLLVDFEAGQLIPSMVRNHFARLGVLQGWKNVSSSPKTQQKHLVEDVVHALMTKTHEMPQGAVIHPKKEGRIHKISH